MSKTVKKDRWLFPVHIRGQERNVWYYRDRRGIDVVAYIPQVGGPPAHFRISAGQMREYLKELDRRTTIPQKGKHK